ARRSIPVERVLAHSAIAPSRRIDPGEKSPWSRPGEAGVALFAEPSTCAGGDVLSPGDEADAVTEMPRDLAPVRRGSAVTGTYDAETGIVTKAFQRRFRPAKVDGMADAATMETLRWVIQKLR